MTSVIRLESKNQQHTVGGFLITLPSERRLVVQWEQECPIQPERDAAKQYVARVMDGLIRDGVSGERDLRDTNWVSVTAMVERVIREWNDAIRGVLSGIGGGVPGGASPGGEGLYPPSSAAPGQPH